ncbi:MAG TPA: efflux RND transporter periplasmic adaptor subunit [Terracidiphilus sp.]|jgi:multidrug resistance efflux pump|nr:efflux RND transporter periplasmic adaptor subunit [Terracidiphilus sp.]
MILGLLTLGSLIWYLLTARAPSDLRLIGTVDANEVLVSAKIPGRVQTLNVEEGQQVKAGELIAEIESDDLAAARKAAQATVVSNRSKLSETEETERQNQGEVSSASINAEAQVRAAQAALAQAQANLEHQKADTTRTVALAKQGIMSEQSRDEAETSLRADEAAVLTAQENISAAQAAFKQAKAHELLALVSARTVASTRGQVENSVALADQANVELGYAQVFAPVSGRVNVLAARQGEVLSSGGTIATVMDLSQTWVYAPLPETQADAVQLGDNLKVVMPSGASVDGKVIAKSSLADFATQRDINGGRKRDIKTVQIKLLIPNPDERYVPGMTAEVYIPKAKLVKQ